MFSANNVPAPSFTDNWEKLSQLLATYIDNKDPNSSSNDVNKHQAAKILSLLIKFKALHSVTGAEIKQGEMKIIPSKVDKSFWQEKSGIFRGDSVLAGYRARAIKLAAADLKKASSMTTASQPAKLKPTSATPLSAFCRGSVTLDAASCTADVRDYAFTFKVDESQPTLGALEAAEKVFDAFNKILVAQGKGPHAQAIAHHGLRVVLKDGKTPTLLISHAAYEKIFEITSGLTNLSAEVKATSREENKPKSPTPSLTTTTTSPSSSSIATPGTPESPITTTSPTSTSSTTPEFTRIEKKEEMVKRLNYQENFPPEALYKELTGRTLAQLHQIFTDHAVFHIHFAKRPYKVVHASSTDSTKIYEWESACSFWQRHQHTLSQFPNFGKVYANVMIPRERDSNFAALDIIYNLSPPDIEVLIDHLDYLYTRPLHNELGTLVGMRVYITQHFPLFLEWSGLPAKQSTPDSDNPDYSKPFYHEDGTLRHRP